MTNARIGAIGILWGVLGTPLLFAGDFSSYRGFQFGSNLIVAAKQAGTQPSEARLMHQRPAVIQELDWRPGSPMQADPAKGDAVQDGQLFLYNGDLFRIVVAYDRYKVEGMTAQDLNKPNFRP